jgi:hypothetical protein
LRQLEQDALREIGIIFPNRKIVASVMKVFEADWRSAAAPMKEPGTDLPNNTAASTAKKVANSIARELPHRSDL